jgi:hypothetical protein
LAVTLGDSGEAARSAFPIGTGVGEMGLKSFPGRAPDLAGRLDLRRAALALAVSPMSTAAPTGTSAPKKLYLSTWS